MTVRVILRKSITLSHASGVVASLLLLIVISSVPPRASAQNTAPFTKKDLLDALRLNTKEKNKVTPAEFVGYIIQRGVDFEMSPSDEVSFRTAGAPSEVIIAIRNNYRRVLPPRSLTINSSPGNCQVFLNGQPRGSTNEAGLLTLRSLKLGIHKLTVRKTNYREVERTVTVSMRGSVEALSLVPLPSKLSANANVPGARFSIRHVGQYSDKIENLELSPGEYDIEIAKPGYRAVSRHVVLAPGSTFILPVTLEKLNIDEMMSTAQQHLGSANFREAIGMFNAVLAEQPNNTQANKGLALAYYHSRNYEQSVWYFQKAISLGDKISFKVKHRHRLVFCTGMVTLSSKAFAFKSDDGFKEGHDFEIPYTKFKEYLLIEEIYGVHLHTKGRIPKPAGKKGEDEKDNNFYVVDTKPSFEACAECSRQLRVILDLMKAGVTGFDDASSGRPTLKRSAP